MPPRRPQRQARSRGYDPTVNIVNASGARSLNTLQQEELPSTVQEESVKEKDPNEKANDDLKKLIEALKSKMGTNSNSPPKKQAPPEPKAKTPWNRSIVKEKEWIAKPAYTILSRISDHEKVPQKNEKQAELTLNSLPHSFLYRPGADGIKVDKLTVKAGKQVGIG